MSSSPLAPFQATPGINPNVPGIPAPTTNPQSLQVTLAALKQAVESLGGARGASTDRAVTFNDLIRLKLLTLPQAAAPGGSVPSGGTGGGGSSGGLPTIANLDLLANIAGATAAPVGTTLSAYLDEVLGSASGQILYRGASDWISLPIGSEGYVLTVSSGEPVWAPGTSMPTGIALTVGGVLLMVDGVGLTT